MKRSPRPQALLESLALAAALGGCSGPPPPATPSTSTGGQECAKGIEQIDEGGYVMTTEGEEVGWMLAFERGDQMVEYWMRSSAWDPTKTIGIESEALAGKRTCREWFNARCRGAAAYSRTAVPLHPQPVDDRFCDSCNDKGAHPNTGGTLFDRGHAISDGRAMFAWIWSESGTETWAMMHKIGTSQDCRPTVSPTSDYSDLPTFCTYVCGLSPRPQSVFEPSYSLEAPDPCDNPPSVEDCPG